MVPNPGLNPSPAAPRHRRVRWRLVLSLAALVLLLHALLLALAPVGVGADWPPAQRPALRLRHLVDAPAGEPRAAEAPSGEGPVGAPALERAGRVEGVERPRPPALGPAPGAPAAEPAARPRQGA
ncbi:MAG: hypothetical protein KGI35_00885, partial [Burkholderiales bacterium]|nr:hypothetical protein [Burkholderiales bacterium]